jgi:hypothetical protein
MTVAHGVGASGTGGAAAASTSQPMTSGSVNISHVLTAKRSWEENSAEFKRREMALIKLFAGTELSTCLVTQEEFQQFCSALDPRFQLPGT